MRLHLRRLERLRGHRRAAVAGGDEVAEGLQGCFIPTLRIEGEGRLFSGNQLTNLHGLPPRIATLFPIQFSKTISNFLKTFWKSLQNTVSSGKY